MNGSAVSARERLEDAELGAHADQHVVDQRSVVLDVLVPRERQRGALADGETPPSDAGADGVKLEKRVDGRRGVYRGGGRLPGGNPRPVSAVRPATEK